MRYTKGNFYKEEGDVFRFLTSNKKTEFIIDKEDFQRVTRFTWQENYKGYIYTVVKIDGKAKTIMLHNFLTGQPLPPYQKDHWDQDKTNNRKLNLRIVTPSENSINRKMRSDNKSGYRGVWRHASNKYWCAQIGFEGKREYLGCFEEIDDAVEARRKAEIKHFGKELI